MTGSSGNFWAGRRVIVTGGAGFLGSYVVEALRERGCARILAPRSSEFDLRQPDRIRAMLKAFPADQIIHLAAVVGASARIRRILAAFSMTTL
jgi:GDP-L-fucose synthase